MNRVQRRTLEPGWVLHHRPYGDSSRILELFTRDRGRVAVVARGARRPGSRHRALLQPFHPLLLSWSARSELGTLTAVEAEGVALSLTGTRLLAAFYVNELLLRLLPRDDADERLWMDYRDVLLALAGGTSVAPALRRFERRLLHQLGYGLNLEHDIVEGRPLDADAHYEYVPEHGPRLLGPGMKDGPLCFPGHELIAIRDDDFSTPAVRESARRLLGASLALYLGDRPLRTRSVLEAMTRMTARNMESTG